MIRKILMLALITTSLSACFFEEVESVDFADDEATPTSPGPDPRGTQGPQAGCGYQVLDMPMPDGLVVMMVLPLECDRRPEELQGTGPVEDPWEDIDIQEEKY